jgi:hypothetical protein
VPGHPAQVPLNDQQRRATVGQFSEFVGKAAREWLTLIVSRVKRRRND